MMKETKDPKDIKILIVSAKSPYWSANLGYKIAKRYRDVGIDVDFLSQYEFENKESWMYSILNKLDPTEKIAYFHKSNTLTGLFQRLFSVTYLKERLSNKKFGDLVGINQSKLPVSKNKIKSAIPSKKYDLVIILVTHKSINVSVLKLIYDIVKAPMIQYAVDMAPMTGGCFYFGDCKNYEKGCTDCPLARSKKLKDVIHKNYLLKQKIYNEIGFKARVNTWMKIHFQASGLFKEGNLINSIPSLTPLFYPINKREAKERLGLPLDKFIFMCGSTASTHKRKGFRELIDALKIYKEKYNNLDKIALLLVGNNPPLEFYELGYEIYYKGSVSVKDLALCYNSADVYLSPSIDDAGPSMVNQALMCGTPVVAFNIGIAVDLIINGKTGYKTKDKDPEDFAKGMYEFFNTPNLGEIQNNCRKLMEEMDQKFKHTLITEIQELIKND